jgi:hypothetical protein
VTLAHLGDVTDAEIEQLAAAGVAATRVARLTERLTRSPVT